MKQAKLKSFRVSPQYKYGFEVPKNFKYAEKLDKKNENTKWMDSNKLEHKQLDDYGVFIDKENSQAVESQKASDLFESIPYSMSR